MTIANSQRPVPWKPILVIAGIGIVLFLVALVAYPIQFGTTISTEQHAWAQFGDYLGGLLNPIFGLLSFLALLLALLLQSQELHLSTRELAKSAEALAAQNESLSRQSFENTFFQLLRRYEDVAERVTWRQERGRSAFESLYVKDLKETRYKGLASEPMDDADKAVLASEEFYAKWRTELAHYYRTLYHVFKFIDRSDLSEDEKARYANIARAQLSTYEICLLFYNGIWGEGKEGFKPLIEKYGLLKHINRDDLLHPNDNVHGSFYDQRAFLTYRERTGRTVD